MNIFTSKSFQLLPPILPVLVAYMLQITLFFSAQSYAQSALILCIGLTAVAVLLYRNLNAWRLILCLIAIGSGFYRVSQITSYYNAFPFTQTKKKCSIMGEVYSFSYHPQSRFPYCTTVYTLSMCTHDSERKAHYFVQVYSRNKPTAKISDIVYIHDLNFKQPANEAFHYYLMKEGIAATAFKENAHISIEIQTNFSLNRQLFNARENLFNSFQSKLSRQTFSLFAAIFMGEKTALKQDKNRLEAPFKQWGIVHYLARSGLHLVIIVSLCELLLRFIPLAFALKQCILLITVLFYFLLTWPSVSFLRALLIFLLYKCCVLFRISDHFLHLLFLCCLFLLLYNPLYLLFLDFQLSFGLTFALAWLNLFKTVYSDKNSLNIESSP